MNDVAPMTITEHHIPEALILTLEGSLDNVSRPHFMKAVHRAIKDQYAHVIVNAKHLICTDTTAVGILFMAYQVLTLHHRRLSLLSPSSSLQSQLQATKFPYIMPIYESLNDALTPKVFPFTVV